MKSRLQNFAITRPIKLHNSTQLYTSTPLFRCKITHRSLRTYATITHMRTHIYLLCDSKFTNREKHAARIFILARACLQIDRSHPFPPPDDSSLPLRSAAACIYIYIYASRKNLRRRVADLALMKALNLAASMYVARGAR